MSGTQIDLIKAFLRHLVSMFKNADIIKAGKSKKAKLVLFKASFLGFSLLNIPITTVCTVLAFNLQSPLFWNHHSQALH